MAKKDVAKLGKKEMVGLVKENLQLVSDGKVTNVDAENAFDAVFDSVIDALVSGYHVGIQGLGVFELRNRSERTAPNPQQKGKTIKVPAHTGLGFSPSSSLKEAVREL